MSYFLCMAFVRLAYRYQTDEDLPDPTVSNLYEEMKATHNEFSVLDKKIDNKDPFVNIQREQCMWFMNHLQHRAIQYMCENNCDFDDSFCDSYDDIVLYANSVLRKYDTHCK